MLLEDVKNFTEFLVWLSGPASAAVILWALSWYIEKRTWWQNLSSGLKEGIVMVSAGSLALGAKWLLGQEELVTQISPVFAAIFPICSAWLVTQIAHFRNPDRFRG